MKTFGELEVGDIIFRYEKGGDRIKARRILKITESEATVLIKYANNRFARLLKEESTCDKDFFYSSHARMPLKSFYCKWKETKENGTGTKKKRYKNLENNTKVKGHENN